MAASSNEKKENQVKRGYVGVKWPTFGIFGPTDISGTIEAIECSNLAQ